MIEANMDSISTSSPLSNSFFLFAFCNYYNLQVMDAEVNKDRGIFRLECRIKGTKGNIKKYYRKRAFREYYEVEINKLIQTGPMAPPTPPV